MAVISTRSTPYASGNSIRSAEKQTPITPLAISQFRARGPKGRGRISLSQDPALSLKYAGELIAAFIEQAGGSVKGPISTGSVRKGLEPYYVTISRVPFGDPRSTADGLEQLHRRSGLSGDWRTTPGRSVSALFEKSLKVAARDPGCTRLTEAIHLEEGSGISRSNRFTARGLAKVLDLFAPHANLLRGHDGGANKTGTLDGVRTLAAYANTSTHGQVRFVISLRSNNGAMRFGCSRPSCPRCSRARAGGGMFLVTGRGFGIAHP